MNFYNKIAYILCSIGSDKYLHLLFSQILTILTIKLLILFNINAIGAVLVGFIIVLSICVVKELIDVKRHNAPFDWNDFVFDLIGCVIGALISIL
jgi:hypothetical protein